MDDQPNLSADIFCDSTGKKWTAVLMNHPPNGGYGVEVWRKEGMRTQYNAECAMEAAYQRIMKGHTP